MNSLSVLNSDSQDGKLQDIFTTYELRNISDEKLKNKLVEHSNFLSKKKETPLDKSINI